MLHLNDLRITPNVFFCTTVILRWICTDLSCLSDALSLSCLSMFRERQRQSDASSRSPRAGPGRGQMSPYWTDALD